MLLGITGFATSGKDTIGAVLRDKYGFHVSAFADPMRTICKAIDPIVGAQAITETHVSIIRYSQAVESFGYNEAKKRYPELRQFLQRLGTEAGRVPFGENHWVDMWRKMNGVEILKGNAWKSPYRDMVVCDVRFLNEAAAIREMGGQIWRVERPGVGPQSDHPSETEQLQIEPDITIVNDGTITDLENQVVELMSESELVI